MHTVPGTPSTRVLAAIVGVVLPALALAVIVRTCYVDVFYGDEWELVPLVEKLLQGHLGVGDLWAQHMEHRPVVPRLVQACLARATGWNTWVDVSLGVALAGAWVPALWWADRRMARLAARQPLPVVVWPAAAVLTCSPVQWENWLWAWQFALLLQVTVTVCAVLALVRPDRHWWSIGAAALLGVVGSFSFGTGLVVWPLGALVLIAVTQEQRRARVLAWMLIGAVVIVAYQQDLVQSPYMPTPLSNFVRLRALAKYLAFTTALLGAPLTPGNWNGALVAGAAGLVAWTGLCLGHVSRRRLAPTAWMPFALGLLAIGSMLATSLGRAGFGFVQTPPSRYATAATFLWVAVLLLLAERAARPGVPWRRHAARAAGIAIVACAVGVGWPRGWEASQAWRDRMVPARASLVAGRLDDALRSLYPMPEEVLVRREILRRWRLAVFRDRAARTP